MSERLLEVSRADSLDSNPLAMDSLVRWALMDPGPYNPRQGVLASLLASGDLGILEDSELRIRLGSWSGALDDLVEDELWLYRETQDRWIPALQERLPLEHAYASDGSRVATGRRPDYRRILGDTLLESYMLARIDVATALLVAYKDLRSLIDEIIQLIDQNLDDP